MKKFIFLFLFLVGVASANAQLLTMKKHYPNTDVVLDTVTNTATAFLGNLVQINTGPGSQRTVSIIWTATKISGTVAGTVKIQGSNDGTNFITLTGAATGQSTTTFTATDVASQTTGWLITGNFCRFYRVSWTGAGTMAASQAATVLVQ